MEVIVYLVLVGGSFGVLSAMVASKKNRDPAAWFIVGLVFAVFGLIAAFIVEPLPSDEDTPPTTGPGEARSDVKSGPVRDSRRCPFCAEEIKAEAIKCRFCSSAVEPSASRCEFCERLVARPSLPCAQFGAEKLRARANEVPNQRCRAELTKRGYIDPAFAR